MRAVTFRLFVCVPVCLVNTVNDGNWCCRGACSYEKPGKEAAADGWGCWLGWVAAINDWKRRMESESKSEREREREEEQDKRRNEGREEKKKVWKSEE